MFAKKRRKVQMTLSPDWTNCNLQAANAIASALRTEQRVSGDNVNVIWEYSLHNISRLHFDRPYINYQRSGATNCGNRCHDFFETRNRCRDHNHVALRYCT